eukprot:scaffold10016_cov170-Amphora_coffeaeformis.AAC.3
MNTPKQNYMNVDHSCDSSSVTAPISYFRLVGAYLSAFQLLNSQFPCGSTRMAPSNLLVYRRDDDEGLLLSSSKLLTSSVDVWDGQKRHSVCWWRSCGGTELVWVGKKT